MGDEFRTTFAHIGDIRSLIPNTVNIMALTATATNETFLVVTSRLCMDNVKLIALPPYRDNICYRVSSKIDINVLTDSLCSEFAAQRMNFPKTVIYVRTVQTCIC